MSQPSIRTMVNETTSYVQFVLIPFLLFAF
jgi:hypothetical protein